MTITLEDNKRTAIAVKLADMKAIQDLLIANEKTLIASCPDGEIGTRLQAFLKDDHKNLGIIDTIIIEYGTPAKPTLTLQKEIEEVEKMMGDSQFTFFDKVAKHELVTHIQAMSGILIHKVAQVIGADVAADIAPLNNVNFENLAHQAQLKGMMESLSILELTGKPADQSGLWARVQDAIVSLSGIAGGLSGLISNSDHEVNICNLIRSDHAKVDKLFAQLLSTNDSQKLEECFAQIYTDLCAHSETEEQVVYPMVRPYYTDVQKLYDEQAEMKQMLNHIKGMNPKDTVEFKAAVELLMSAVNTHVKEEENDLFPRIQANFDVEQQKHMATEFKTTKSHIQDQQLTAASH